MPSNDKKTTYNRKVFLLPDGILSMAAIHCKVKESGEAQIRIADCNNTIKLWNDINTPEGFDDMIEKVSNLRFELGLFEEFLMNNKLIV